MAEAVIFTGTNTHPDPIKDRTGCWKAGMIVDVGPDGRDWGRNVVPPKFAILKMPGVSVDRVRKYIAEQLDDAGGLLLEPVRFRRRLWQIQTQELPVRAQNLLAAGSITIGPTGDYTWTQVKNYFLRHDTMLRETEGV